ncbi:MAG TPA: SPOR domain-containing protein [Longimicrobiales bacterium]
MNRHLGWTLITALVIVGCGSGEQPEAQPPADATPEPVAEPVARPTPPPTTAPDTAADPADAAADTAKTAMLPDGPLYTVQVAAWPFPDSAQVWQARLRQRGLPVWTVQAQVHGRTFHRLRVGAHPSLSAARELGRRITREYHWPVWVAPVEQRAAVPADAVEATRALLGGA